MSIAYNLPLNDWYFDTTSQWTLDYPPLFAVFELLLALLARLFRIEDALLQSKTPIRSESVIVYQKITVILSDLVYFYGVYKLCNSLEPLLCGAQADDAKGTRGAKSNNGSGSKVAMSKDNLAPPPPPQPALKDDRSESGRKEGLQQVTGKPASPTLTSRPAKLNLSDAFYRPDATSCIATLLLLQPGLLLVDHIHFQYNGFLSGVLLISASDIVDRRYMAATFWFAVLINLKHIYLYCAPAYGMYVLVSHCLATGGKHNRIWTFLFRAGRLGSIVISVFVITYTPFADQAILRQIVGRLFPFKRGLTHAYWAPNIWSLYNLADKLLATVFRHKLKVKFDLESISTTKRVTSTSGLVQEYEHLYLPSVKPITTFILVGVFVLPIVIKFLFRIDRRSPRLFLKGLTLAAFTSFMFGWHVHEKAILLILLPATPLCFTDPQLRSAILRLTLAGTYSIFPLLHHPAEYPTKVCSLVAFYCYLSNGSLARVNKIGKKRGQQGAQDSRHHKLLEFINALASRLYGYLDKAYVLTLIFNELYIILLFGRLNHSWNPVAGLNRFEFLPLMLTSTLAASGISASYMELYYDFVFSPDELAVTP